MHVYVLFSLLNLGASRGPLGLALSFSPAARTRGAMLHSPWSRRALRGPARRALAAVCASRGRAG
eukprot:8986863-Pyramimonas_sp.AAC.1